jgi:hypothetical protein
LLLVAAFGDALLQNPQVIWVGWPFRNNLPKPDVICSDWADPAAHRADDLLSYLVSRGDEERLRARLRPRLRPHHLLAIYQ